jgi:hypothetical protein
MIRNVCEKNVAYVQETCDTHVVDSLIPVPDEACLPTPPLFDGGSSPPATADAPGAKHAALPDVGRGVGCLVLRMGQHNDS